MRIAAVGDNCFDVYDELGVAFPGGNPVNVAVYTVRLGGEASYTGAVGDDDYGRRMIRALEAKGVDTSHVRVLPGSTAISHVELVDGERVFGEYDEGVLASFKLRDEDIDFICGHDLVVSGVWGNAEDELSKIRARGTPVAFDFDGKLEGPVVAKAIHDVDYAFFAADEGDSPGIRSYMESAHRRGPKIVTVTLGSEGSVAYDGEQFVSCGIVPCDVKDTLGAGDSYIAGFLRGILEGRPLKECMAMGAASSSSTLQYMGAW